MDIICTDLNATAARVEELGGKRAAGYPADPHVIVMLDPEDNEFVTPPEPPAMGRGCR